MSWKRYTIVSDAELDFLVSTVRSAPSGDIVIAGTYKGGDAMMVRATSPDRRLVVIDSFAGLADATEGDQGTVHKAGEFACGLVEYIRNFAVAGYSLPDEIHPQYITPESLDVIHHRPVAVVWLDLDFYSPTIACMRHFWDWLVPGGRMLTHDFSWTHTPGIERAVAESGLDWKRGVGNIAYVVK